MEGGGLKITDFLEDPVDITNYTPEELCKLPINYCFYGSFIQNISSNVLSDSTEAYTYIGYIPRTKSTDSKYNEHEYQYANVLSPNILTNIYNNYTSGPFTVAISIATLSSNENWFNHVYFLGFNDLDLEERPFSKISYPDNFFGNIWVGKYKQIIQNS